MNQQPLKVVELFRKERCEAPLRDPTLIPMKRSLPRMNHPPFKALKQLRNEMYEVSHKGPTTYAAEFSMDGSYTMVETLVMGELSTMQ